MVTRFTIKIGVSMSEYSGTTNWKPLIEAYSKKTKTKKKRKSNARLRKKRS